MTVQDTIKLTKEQQWAFDELQSLTRGSKQFFRLTGYAGTGKTFLAVEYIKWLISERKKFLVAAPTNKAAKNIEKMALTSGVRIEPITIAKMLGQVPTIDEVGNEKFVSHATPSISDYEVVLIDEYSMVNKEDFTEICFQAGNRTKIVFIGDDAQLPPIGETISLVSSSSLIKASATLSEVVRYDGELARLSEEIRSNPIFDRRMYPFRNADDGTVVKCSDRASWLYEAAGIFSHSSWQEDPNSCRILVFRNRTASELNNYIRQRIYGIKCTPFEVGDLLIARFPCFRTMGKDSDLKIVIQNSEEMRVTGKYEKRKFKYYRPSLEYYSVPVLTESGRDIDLKILTPSSQIIFDERLKQLQEQRDYKAKWHLFKSFDHCPFAYSLTTHKAQGSSINKVFIDVDDMATAREKQQMLYTAVTRAKEKIFVY